VQELKGRLALRIGIAACIAAAGLSIYKSGHHTDTDVTLVTHDSFVMSEAQVRQFDKQTSLKLNLIKSGDAGSLTNRLVLSKSSPIADVVFGIDNTFAGRAVSADIIEGSLVPMDYGDVCFNYDKLWFAAHKVAAPTNVDQLLSSTYRHLTVVENPNTSSTGLAFLIATVDKYGAQGWQNYWTKLKANGLKVDDGWETAYYTDFSGSSGKGNFPIVLSYASSPADEVRSNGQSQTAIIDDACFRQTEYAGVLKGAHNPTAAQAVVDYLQSLEFQATFPTSMYMYPIRSDAPLGKNWQKFAKPATHIFGQKLDINAHRTEWLAQWSALFE